MEKTHLPEKNVVFIVFFPLLFVDSFLFSGMAIHKRITKPGIYFITFTCYEWIRLIEMTKGYDLVYNWFNVLLVNGHTVTGYVIMPNHLHLLLYYAGGLRSLNAVVGNGKRFIAYDIVKRLEVKNQVDLLCYLSNAVHPSDRKKGKQHELWIDSFDVKECRTEKFIMQKLNYIHNNPCAGKWSLADSPIHYPHSSASFYISGKPGLYPVRDYRDFLYFDLWDEEHITPTSPS